MAEKGEAYKLYKDVMETLRETAIFMPDKLEVKLKFKGAKAELTYSEHHSQIPKEKREVLIQQSIAFTNEKLQKFQKFMPFEFSILPIKDGAKLLIKGERSFVLAALLAELLAQLTVRDVIKTAGIVLLLRGNVPRLWTGET